jgi:hypothetical protein
MFIQDLIVKHGIITIAVMYFAFNLVHKKLMNIVIFLTLLVLTYPFFKNKINGIIFTLVGSLCLGIMKNFHLLENFEDHKKIVRLSNRLLDKMPSYKIHKITVELDTVKPTIQVNESEIETMKQELENGYSRLEEYPIFISKDNFIIQGNVLYKVLTKYPELDSTSRNMYKIDESKEYIVKKIPIIKLMSGITENEFNMLDISKM